jgi:hypothetical protein
MFGAAMLMQAALPVNFERIKKKEIATPARSLESDARFT